MLPERIGGQAMPLTETRSSRAKPGGRTHHHQYLGSAIAWAMALLACEPQTTLEDTERVLHPSEISHLEGPGTRLVAGHFYDLRGGDGGLVTFARNHDADPAEVTIIDRSTGSVCRLAGAERLADFGAGVAYQGETDAQGFGTLRLADYGCRSLDTLPNALMPLPPGTLVDHALIVSDSMLLDIDLVGGGFKTVLSGISGVPIEGIFPVGDHVAYLGAGAQYLEVGQNVRQFVRDRWNEVVVEDDFGVRRFDSYGTATVLAEDGCELRQAGDWLTFYSPCAERVAHAWQGTQFSLELGKNIDLGTATLTLGSELERQGETNAYRISTRFLRAYAFSDVDDETQTGSLSYVDVALPDGVFPIVSASEDSLHDEVAEVIAAGLPPHLTGVLQHVGEHASLEFSARSPSLGALIDVQAGVGTLVLPSSAGPQQVATGVPVAPLSGSSPDHSLHYTPDPSWFIANFDGQRGDLYELCRICRPASAKLVAAQVPLDGGIGQLLGSGLDNLGDYETRALILRDFDGRAGTVWAPDSQAALASGVAPNEYIGLEIMPYGLAYLTQYDAATHAGELDYFSPNLAVHAAVARGVSEFRVVMAPRQGIVYVKQTGDDAGIWFVAGAQ